MADRRISEADALALTDEIVAVCKRHGLWIAHEDDHGGFIFQRASTEEWLREATNPEWSKFPRAADWYGSINDE